MSKTPSLQLLGTLFSTIAYFARERLPYLKVHQTTMGNPKISTHDAAI
jgi:hypothetical protein